MASSPENVNFLDLACMLKIEKDTTSWVVTSEGSLRASKNQINCRESGVTMRFAVPLASLTGAKIRLAGDQSLMRRPIDPLRDAMMQLGVKVSVDANGVNVEGGPPKGGRVRIRGDVSSQFISGLLLAGPKMAEGLHLDLTSPLESRSYLLLTIKAMEQHGINVDYDRSMVTFDVTRQVYKPMSHRILGDYSSASFAMCATAITDSKLLVRNLPQDYPEPDSVILEILSRMGALVQHLPEGVMIEGRPLKATDVNISESPDLGPAIAVLGCFAEGETRVTGAERLRYKESDRLSVVVKELKSLGAKIEETDDGLIASGPTSLRAGEVDSHRDHRIAMALGVAAIGATGRVVIKGAECVNKSYPEFFNDMRSLGVEVVGG
jgi:3-phosphoshikimate 1-carboxyvinyltransferase